MNHYLFQDIKIGQNESFKKTITEDMEIAFREITGDENPLHNDDEYAIKVSSGRYNSHVVFGMLTASLYSTLVGMYLPGKYSLIHSLEKLEFRKPVFAGDILSISGTVKGKQDDLKLILIDAVIRNQDEETVSKALIKVIVQK